MERSKDSLATRELVRQAQQGDRDAFGRLLQRYRYRLESLIHIRLGPQLRRRVDVDDVRQETYLRALRSISEFQWRDNGSFFRWLVGIAERVIKILARHHLHAEKREVFREVPMVSKFASDGAAPPHPDRVAVDSGTSPTKAMRRAERFIRLEEALGKLSEEHREVVILAKVQCLPIKDIASRMHRSADAVSMLLLRASRRLKAYFGTTDSLHLPPCELRARPEKTPQNSDVTQSQCETREAQDGE